MNGEQTAPLSQPRWRSGVSNREVIAFGIWITGEFTFALTATLVLVHKAVSLPAHRQLPGQFVERLLLTWCGSMALLAAIAGAVVFRRSAPWRVVLLWPWLVGIAVGIAFSFALSGQMDAGSKLCQVPDAGSCDTSWGVAAALVGIVAGVVLGGLFVGFASAKRLVFRRRS